MGKLTLIFSSIIVNVFGILVVNERKLDVKRKLRKATLGSTVTKRIIFER